jgi:hypothetical protein
MPVAIGCSAVLRARKRRAEGIEQEIAALRPRVDDLDTNYPFANKLDEEAKSPV